MRALALTLLAVAAGSVATAQSFNVDVGIQPAYSPIPSSGFGAGATQPGTWNAINGSTAGPFALVDLGGAATAVTLSRTGPASTFSVDNASTSGDDAALMDDGYDPGTLSPWSTWTFSNLAAGDYQLYTYGWAPDNAGFLSRITVAGSSGPIAVGGWPSPFAYVQSTQNYPPVPPPTTHAIHLVTVSAGGSIAMTISNALSFGTLNGFQLVHGSGGPGTAFCIPGQGGVMGCQCGNPGGAGVGCANTGSAGASLSAAGTASLGADVTDPGSVQLTGSSMLAGSSCIFLQGDGPVVSGTTFGAGIRCAGGQLLRLYVKPIVGGSQTAPTGADRSISNRSFDLSAPITAGQTRYYQTYYRDPSLVNPGGGCPAITTFNVTSAQQIVWGP